MFIYTQIILRDVYQFKWRLVYVTTLAFKNNKILFAFLFLIYTVQVTKSLNSKKERSIVKHLSDNILWWRSKIRKKRNSNEQRRRSVTVFICFNGFGFSTSNVFSLNSVEKAEKITLWITVHYPSLRLWTACNYGNYTLLGLLTGASHQQTQPFRAAIINQNLKDTFTI